VSHTINTAAVADGTHQLRVAAVDAANNETQSSEVAIQVDNHGPHAQIELPAREQTSAAIPISWSASDGNGSGVTSYDVQVSVAGGPWEPWLSGVTGTSATYPGQAGGIYTYRVRARDQIGQVGAWVDSPAARVASTQSIGPGTNPVEPVDPGKDAGASKADKRVTPRMKLTSVRRRGGRLYVAGRISQKATGRVRIVWTARNARRTRRRGGWARISNGRFRVTLRVGGRGRLTVRYGGDSAHAPRALRTTI
jgi:hypothetical protein